MNYYKKISSGDRLFTDSIGSPIKLQQIGQPCTCGGIYTQLHGINEIYAKILKIPHKKWAIVSCSCCTLHFTDSSGIGICTDKNCCPFYN